MYFQVILSHNHPLQIPSELPANLRQVRGIVAAYENGVIFGDGSQADVDVILFCTGKDGLLLITLMLTDIHI